MKRFPVYTLFASAAALVSILGFAGVATLADDDDAEHNVSALRRAGNDVVVFDRFQAGLLSLARIPGDALLFGVVAEGMETIAEYVQDAESMVLLDELGVDLAQGYFVGRPTRKPEHKSTPISLDSRRMKAPPLPRTS